MRIGLVGAQGVGKTTLAEEVSNETDLPLLLTSTAKVFEENGIRPDQVLTFSQRIDIQHKILTSAEALWGDHATFITDRTPIDMLAYMMIDFNSDTRLSESETKLFTDYRERCIESTNEYFTSVLLVQPGITPMNVEKSRASLDVALVESMSALMMGILMNDNISAFRTLLPKEVTDLKERVMVVNATINTASKMFLEGIERTTCH